MVVVSHFRTCAPTTKLLLSTVMTSSDEQLERIMEAIKTSQTKLDEKLAEFRAEIKESQEKAAASAVRRAREPAHSFKKKGHQEQHRFNERVDETLERAQTELQSIPHRQPHQSSLELKRLSGKVGSS